MGAISEIRGIESLINACENINGTLVLAGKFTSKYLEQRIRSLKGWKNVDYRGLINREEVKQLLSESKAGIVTFLAEPNHINSQPNKMFEYMSAQLPVICSNFELWKSIVEVNNCGFVLSQMIHMLFQIRLTFFLMMIIKSQTLVKMEERLFYHLTIGLSKNLNFLKLYKNL